MSMGNGEDTLSDFIGEAMLPNATGDCTITIFSAGTAFSSKIEVYCLANLGCDDGPQRNASGDEYAICTSFLWPTGKFTLPISAGGYFL